MNEIGTAPAEQQPTVREMRAYLRANYPEMRVGVRGFLSAEARNVYNADHGVVHAA